MSFEVALESGKLVVAEPVVIAGDEDGDFGGEVVDIFCGLFCHVENLGASSVASLVANDFAYPCTDGFSSDPKKPR